TLRVAAGSRGAPLSMRIPVDPTTKLPDPLAVDAEDGKRYTTAIHSPDHGPADTDDLGVPRTAKAIDRTPWADAGRATPSLKAGHPAFGIGEPDHDRECLGEPKPSGGPAGTILLRGRDTNPRAAGAPDHFRLWIDPKANDLSMRTEIRVADAADHSKVAFIDT